MNTIQVFVVSQQFLFRQGIEHALAGVEDIQVAGATEINDEVLSAIDNSPPDVAIVDIDGPSDSGLTLARRIKQRSPSIAVIVLISNPSDAQLIDNLALARSRTVDKITVARKNYLVWLTERLLRLLPYRSFAVFTLVVYLLFMVVAISGLLLRPARPQVFKVAVILGCIFIAGLLLFMTDRYLEKSRIPAIAMKEELPVRYGPSEADTIAFNVHSGTKVYITGSEGSWYQIRLESNEGGWVNIEALERI